MVKEQELNPVYHPPSSLDPVAERKINQVLITIYPLVMALIDFDELTKTSGVQAFTRLTPLINETLEKTNIELSYQEKIALENKLNAELFGLGPVQPLLEDKSVNDILINSAQEVFVERSGILFPTEISFQNDQHLMTIITRLLSRINRRVDEMSPYVNARLPDGSRVNVIIPPLALKGPTLSIRKFFTERLSLKNMIQSKTLTPEIVDFLAIAIQSRLNILITGGTGTGKTTLLNALSALISDNERIVTIEDVVELQLQKPDYVQLETRMPNIEGGGGIDQRALLINALRMRPDRIIIGEVRGAEVFEMLQAMNTGHDGSLSTVHASAPEEVPSRLVNMASLTGFNYPPATLFQQIANCIDLIVEVQRLPDGSRVLSRITECLDFDGENIKLRDLFYYQYHKAKSGEYAGNFYTVNVEPKFLPRIRRYGLAEKLLAILSSKPAENHD